MNEGEFEKPDPQEQSLKLHRCLKGEGEVYRGFSFTSTIELCTGRKRSSSRIKEQQVNFFLVLLFGYVRDDQVPPLFQLWYTQTHADDDDADEGLRNVTVFPRKTLPKLLYWKEGFMYTDTHSLTCMQVTRYCSSIDLLLNVDAPPIVRPAVYILLSTAKL